MTTHMFAKTLLLFIAFPALVCAQDKSLSADFDGDRIPDKVYVDAQDGVVVYELSSQGFKPVKSSGFEDSGEIFFENAKGGFKVKITQMRAGGAYQFRYAQDAGKMRLIGMERYEFGPASNDGSGKSSVNLITGKYVGEWNYFDERRNKLIKMPTIAKSMNFQRVYFDTFKDEFTIYSDKDAAYYAAEKFRLYKQ